MSTEEQRPSNIAKRLAIAAASYSGNAEAAKSELTSPDPKVRSSSLLALHRIGQLGPDELAGALVDTDSSVRRLAAELAAKYPDVSLDAALVDNDPFVVEMALWSLGERGTGDLTAICDLAGNHHESLVREAAVATLGAIGDEKGLATVISALADKPNVRRRAAVALAAFEGEHVTEALRRASHDRDWQTRQIAEDLLEITEGASD